MNSIKKVFSVALAASMVASLAACGNDNTPSSSNTSNPATPSSSTATDTPSSSEALTETATDGKKTFHTYMGGSPKTWNPHEWETSDDSWILGFTDPGFFDWEPNEDHSNYVVKPGAAAALPVDITEEYAGKEEWGIPADAKNGDGWAYKITLRDDLCWEDGTPIKAQDFVDSVQRLLDPKMKNYRASDTYDGTITFVNAKDYYWDGEEGTKKVTWDQVGLKATGDYELTYILSKPCNEFYMCYNGSLPLVKLDLYDSLTEDKGDIKKSKYGTSVETTASWGPFKLVEYQEDKIIRLEKNDKWYGWKPDYEGFVYNYNAIDCQIVKEHSTVLQLFLQGKLDSIGLNNDDMKTYGSSDYLHLSPGTYTWRFSFNTDYDRLKSFETPGTCKTMPTYIEFRKAFSRMLNRKEYCATCTACNIPAVGLFNRLYISNPATGEIYRDNPRAEQTLRNVYGGTDVNAITGYDLEEAKALFQQAYEKAVADGNYRDGDTVELNFMLYKDSEAYQKIINFMQGELDRATAGTGLEGKCKIKLTPDEDYYTKASMGEFEVVMVSVGGAAMNTPVLLAWYCDDGKKNEYGFNANVEKLKATVAGEEYDMTYADWAKELTDGRWANADPALRAEALAVVEEGILSQYRTIPVYSTMSGNLMSHRLSYEVDEYLPIVGFGKSILSMDDAAWAKHIADNNGQLAY